MNDERDFGRRVTDVFDGTAPSRGPDDLLEDVFAVTGSTRPRRRWRVRLTEKPMRYDSSLVSGSPTVRAGMLVAATMLLLVALAATAIAGAQLLGRGETYVVAPDGSGDFTTIAEALGAAGDGDTVLVRPGTYREDLVIRSEITLRGDGERDSVVVETQGAGISTIVDRGTPIETSLPVGVDLQLSDATLESLTLRSTQPLVVLRVNGGSPTLRDLDVASEVAPAGGDEISMLLAGGSNATLSNVDLAHRLVLKEASTMTLADSHLAAAVEAVGPGWVTVVGNHFGEGSQLLLSDGSGGEVSRNEFVGSSIAVGSASEVLLRENLVRGVAGSAITVSHDGTSADIRENDIRDSVTGVAIGPGTVVTVAANTICGNETNIFESSSATTEMHDNEVSATCLES